MWISLRQIGHVFVGVHAGAFGIELEDAARLETAEADLRGHFEAIIQSDHGGLDALAVEFLEKLARFPDAGAPG